MTRLLAGAALVCTVAAGAAHADGPALPPVGGLLARAVLLAGPPLTAGDLPAELSPADRDRLLAYLERRQKPGSTRGAAAADAGLQQRRLRLEREIAAVIDDEGVQEEAAAIATTAPLEADLTANPAAQAEWAEGVLRARPGSPAAAYLYAFLASRYRLMFEQGSDADRSERERMAKKYRTMLERTRNAGDPLLALLAADLDGLPALGPPTAPHPREYLPDT